MAWHNSVLQGMGKGLEVGNFLTKWESIHFQRTLCTTQFIY